MSKSQYHTFNFVQHKSRLKNKKYFRGIARLFGSRKKANLISVVGANPTE